MYRFSYTLDPNLAYAGSFDIHQQVYEYLRSHLASDWVLVPGSPHSHLFSLHDPKIANIPVEGVKLIDENVPPGREAIASFLQLTAGINKTTGRQVDQSIVEAARSGYHQAVSNGHGGSAFSRLFQRSIWLHEKIRQETALFQIAVNVAGAVRELAEKILGTLSQKQAVLIGDNDLKDALSHELERTGCTCIVDTAGDVATSWDAAAIVVYLGTSDTGLTQLYKTRVKWRRRAPIVLIDLSDTNLTQQKFKRFSNLYFYNRHDLDAMLSRNNDLLKQELDTVDSWLKDEVENFAQWFSSDERFQFAGIVGASPAMQHIFELISRVARNNITVLIDGESGTGKELVAQAIHGASGRSEQPFIVVNCGAIPENLLESELFGHVRGAFTGAIANKEGLFEAADGGTLFLDEIGELPQLMQVKLLRVLQNSEIKRVGSNDTYKVDVRILAATNKNLQESVAAGEFRSDLFYRLNVVQITLPPLRARADDIRAIADHMLKRVSGKLQKNVSGFSPDAMNKLMEYHWPGNVRELENAVERSVALTVGEKVSIWDLPQAIQDKPAHTNASEHPTAPMVDRPVQPNEVQLKPAPPLTLKAIEKIHIFQTLNDCHWNFQRACQHLGIGRTTLWRKIKEYELSRQESFEVSSSNRS